MSPKGVHGSKAPHGTPARYQGHGCRCAHCRRAWREYQWQRGVHRPRADYLAAIEPPHGTESRYVNRHCRCDACKEASRDARRRRRAKAPA